MCFWCTIDYVQCNTCCKVFCQDCGQKISDIEEQDLNVEFDDLVEKYSKLFLIHKENCKSVEGQEYFDDRCKSCVYEE